MLPDKPTKSRGCLFTDSLLAAIPLSLATAHGTVAARIVRASKHHRRGPDVVRMCGGHQYVGHGCQEVLPWVLEQKSQKSTTAHLYVGHSCQEAGPEAWGRTRPGAPNAVPRAVGHHVGQRLGGQGCPLRICSHTWGILRFLYACRSLLLPSTLCKLHGLCMLHGPCTCFQNSALSSAS